ncbi:MAG: hypothetical protein MJ182_00595 [Treponema sp.]|nr:hypothetical protein [Treponema sp.]
MKTKIRDIVSIGIFFVLLSCAVLLVRPVYKRLAQEVSSYARNIKESFEEQFSMKISYKALSPSVLSAVSFKDVTVTSLSGDEIALIKKIRLDYKLWKLIRGDFANGFKSFVVDGAHVSGSELALLIQENQAKFDVTEKEKKEKTQNSAFDASELFSDVPISVLIKNTTVTYSDKDFSVQGSIKKMNLNYDNKTKQLALGADTSVQGAFKDQNVKGNLSFDGKIFEGFENSSVTFTLQGFTDGNIKLGKLSFHLVYNNNLVTFSTINNSFPFSLQASYNIQTQDAQVELNATELSAASLLQVQKKSEIYKKISDLRLTTDSFVKYSVSDNKLKYSSNTSVAIPSVLVPSGMDVTVSLWGNEKKIVVDSINVQGEKYDASGSLEYVYKNMNLSGNIAMPRVETPAGTVLSSDIYFDPLEKGFIAFIPQFYIDDNVYTALQLTGVPGEDSFDFSFEGYDYSHMEADSPGRVSIDGSYLISENYMQTSVAANTVYLDSTWKTAISFVEDLKAKQNMSKATASMGDYVFSADGYFSTDFSSVSYNFPYILVANTVKENQALMFSFDGNEQSVSLSQADLILGKQAFHGSGALDILAESDEVFMMFDISSGGIPYHFTGSVAEKNFVLSGDYDTLVQVDFSNEANINGLVSFENLPFMVPGASFVSTINADFVVSEEDGFDVVLSRFEIEEAGNQLQIKPRLAFTGNANRYGARLDSIVYSDIYSQLDGTADVVYTISEDIMASGGLKLELKNPMNDESLSISAEVANPDMMSFSPENLMKDFYVDGNVQVNNLNMNRFTKVKSNNNSLTASVYASGTVEHPYVSASLDNLSLFVSSDVMRMSGSAVMENHDIMVNEFKFNYNVMDINNVTGEFSLDTFIGSVSANFDALLMEETLHIPFTVTSSDVIKKPGVFLPTDFTVCVNSDDIYGSFVNEKRKLSVTGFFSEDGINIMTSENFGFFASYLKTGDLFASWNCEGYAKAKFNGMLEKGTGNLSGRLSEVDIDLKELWSVINMEKTFNIYKGRVNGNIEVSGTFENPTFTGALRIRQPEINIPMVMKERLVTEQLLVLFGNSEINIPESRFTVKKNGEVFAFMKIIFDKWMFEGLELGIRTDKNKYVPVDMEMTKGVSVAGDVSLALNMGIQGNKMELTGDIFAERSELFVNLTKVVQNANQNQTNESNMSVNCSLNIQMGTHVRVNVDPLLRAIFVPGGRLKIAYEQESDQLNMDGLLLLKSGDVSYLNRNFYVKEGSLKFSPSDDPFNPMINVRAETRERDEKGETVTISLNAQNQFIRDFNPRFSSVPAKSEMEIQTLLGQIVMADSESVGNFLFAAGDYAFQALVGRKMENKLRDFLNFDIFSLRTNIIQNTLNFSLANRNSAKTMNAGNFFDNSTVYIGKYLGSALYVDAMVNLQYDEKRIRDATTVGGILFRPEFGVEMESPFGNIRWNVAPDIEAMMNKQYVPATSVSLSWKFAF